MGLLLAAIALLSFLCVFAIRETRDTALGEAESDRDPSTDDRTPEETNADR